MPVIATFRWRQENKKLVQSQTELEVKVEVHVGMHEILSQKIMIFNITIS